VVPVYEIDEDGMEIIPLEADEDILDQEIVYEEYYKNYTSSGINVTAEPDPFIVLYPKREDNAKELDFKMTFAIIGIVIGVSCLICVVLVPFIYHTCLHCKDRAKDRVKKISKVGIKETIRPTRSRLDISVFNDSEEDRRYCRRAEENFKPSPIASARTILNETIRI